MMACLLEFFKASLSIMSMEQAKYFDVFNLQEKQHFSVLHTSHGEAMRYMSVKMSNIDQRKLIIN